MNINKVVRFIFSVGVSLLAGAIGSFYTIQSISTWYAMLNKPFFNPPNWIFAPVWSTLYVLMGIALYIVWGTQSSSGEKRTAMKLFFMQLVLNALWSILFFGLQIPIIAFIEIVVLLFVIFLTTKRFYSISKFAGILFIPYLLWVTFATLLNFSIWILN